MIPENLKLLHRPFKAHPGFPNWHHSCAAASAVSAYAMPLKDVLGTSALGLSNDRSVDVVAEIVWVGPKHHTLTIARYNEDPDVVAQPDLDPDSVEALSRMPALLVLAMDISLTAADWLGVAEQMAAKFLHDEEAGVDPVVDQEKMNAINDADRIELDRRAMDALITRDVG